MFEKIDSIEPMVLKGLAAVSSKDRVGDTIDVSTIKTDSGPLLFNHDPNKPIGKFRTLSKTAKEWIVELTFNPISDLAREMYYSALKGFVTGLSGMYFAEYASDGTISNADVPELSLTPTPMHPDAQILKSMRAKGINANLILKSLQEAQQEAETKAQEPKVEEKEEEIKTEELEVETEEEVETHESPEVETQIEGEAPKIEGEPEENIKKEEEMNEEVKNFVNETVTKAVSSQMAEMTEMLKGITAQYEKGVDKSAGVQKSALNGFSSDMTGVNALEFAIKAKTLNNSADVISYNKSQIAQMEASTNSSVRAIAKALLPDAATASIIIPDACLVEELAICEEDNLGTLGALATLIPVTKRNGKVATSAGTTDFRKGGNCDNKASIELQPFETIEWAVEHWSLGSVVCDADIEDSLIDYLGEWRRQVINAAIRNKSLIVIDWLENSTYASAVTEITAGTSLEDDLMSLKSMCGKCGLTDGVYAVNCETLECLQKAKCTTSVECKYLFPGLRDESNMTIFGKRIIVDNAVPANIVYYGPFNQFRIVERKGLTIDSSTSATWNDGVTTHNTFQQDKTVYRAYFRRGGYTVFPQAFSKLDIKSYC